MKKNQKLAGVAFRWALFCGIAATSLVGCKDYDDDIDNLNNKVDELKTSVESLLADIKAGKFVKNIEATAGGIKVTFSNDESKDVAIEGKAAVVKVDENGNLVDGDGKIIVKAEDMKGEPGKNGLTPEIKDGMWWIGETNTGVPATPTGADGHSAYVVEGDGAYTMYVWNTKDEKYVSFSLPRTTNVVTDIVFVPNTLSAGGAPIILFPTIIHDETDGVSADYTNNNQPWYAVTVPAEPSSILYAGKVDLTYQVNPQSTAFDAMEVINFGVKGQATIVETRSQADNGIMIFNGTAEKGQRFYDMANGVLNAKQSYPGKGLLTFRAKAWQFAEMTATDHEGSERNIYELKVKNGNDTVYSEVAPGRHLHINQSDVRLVNDKVEVDATTHENLYADKFRPYNSYGVTFTTAPSKDAANAYYKGLNAIPTFSISAMNREDVAGAQGLNLTEKIKAFFLDNNKEMPMGKGTAFDDYQIKFELVSFENLGVDQTMRYLVLSEETVGAGTDDRQVVTKAFVKNPNGYPGEEQGDHSAAIGRTPIVRVKLVAPVEDGANASKEENVVASRLIKLEITGEATPDEIVITGSHTIMLQHVTNSVEYDMDHIYNDKRVQANSTNGRAEFLSHYQSFNETTDPATKNTVYIKERLDGTEFQNQLDIFVEPTAFSKDHIQYIVKGEYVAKANQPYVKVIVVDTINVVYPEVNAPQKTQLNWVDNYFKAHGRVNTADNDYEMVAVLNDMFDLNNYDAKAIYANKGYNLDSVAKPTLSFELVDLHNNASNIADTEDDGVRLYQTAEGKWEIALEKNDAGRSHINAEGKTDKRIKMRAVISFNECIDGLYGTCTAAADAHHKYAKTAADKLPDCTGGVTGTINPHPASDYSNNGGKAPETGRYRVVIDEFEVAFVTPIIFKAKTIDPLYDKYQGVENRAYFHKSFQLFDYLYEGAQVAERPNHIIYDFAQAGTGNGKFAIAADGWCKHWVEVFNVYGGVDQEEVFYHVRDAKFADGTSLDAENMKKIKVYTDENGDQYLTWENNGQDIAREFTIYVDVCVRHTWGQNCEDDFSVVDPTRGHSAGTLAVPVKFHK